MNKWYHLGFWVEMDLASPDGNSGRTLFLNTHIPTRRWSRIWRIKLCSWCLGENRLLEKWLNKKFIYPEF